MVWKARKFIPSRYWIIVASVALVISSLAWAQGDDPGCALRVTGDDTGCSGAVGCDNRTGCSVYDFHVVCGGTFELKAWVTGDASCGHCAACLTIYPRWGGGPIGGCHTDDAPYCSQQQGACVMPCQITLSPGYYEMQVCLVSCSESDFHTCCEHPEYNFVAHGCLAGNGPACP